MEIPKELLSKEFLSQFKSEEDVSKFLTTLHSRVLEQMLEGEMDVHLGYEKHSASGINTGNSGNGKYSKKIQTVVWKEKKEFTSDLKNIYNAPTKEAALLELDMFEQKWGAKYPYAIRSWRANWDELTSFFVWQLLLLTPLFLVTNQILSNNPRLRPFQYQHPKVHGFLIVNRFCL